MPKTTRKVTKSSETETAYSGTVGFRLDPEAQQALLARSHVLDTSPHALARAYVIEGLTEAEERRATREIVTALHSQIVELRKDFALALETLLVSAGKVEEEAARGWIRENFRSE